MRLPVYYIVDGVEHETECRVHRFAKRVGEGLAFGTGYDLAERVEVQPRLVFWTADVPAALKRGGVVSVATGEAYMIDHTEPPDGDTTTAVCRLMSASEAAGLPVRA